MSAKKRVILGMSGGVDSSVSAWLLLEKGYEVIGLFMRNWQEEGSCNASVDFQDVASVSTQMGIPHYTVNFTKEYYEKVFARCLVDFQAGRTPNPDVLCNQEIKFKLFFEKALELDADYVATGHYARTFEKEGGSCLSKAVDLEKDQSYFLYTVKSDVLKRVLFPIGDLNKRAVREIAREKKMATAEKRDSTGICFIGERNFPEFLSRYLPQKEGPICTLEGKEVGRHKGIFFYTIGQRHGLHLGGEGPAWYVARKEVKENRLLVVQGEDHPALWSKALLAKEASWVRSEPIFPLTCQAKIRYRSADVACLVEKKEEGLSVTFERPVKAATAGQSIVFYVGEECLGGAIIDHVSTIL